MHRVSANLICGGNPWDRYGYSIFLTIEGEVYSVGNHAKRGHGHEEIFIYPPKKIDILVHIIAIDCGDWHTVCLDSDAKVFSFGSNFSGQLGIGENRYSVEYIHIPQKVNLPPIKQVACGSNFTICVSESDNMYSFGGNFYGQLGLDYSEVQKVLTSPQKITSLNDIEFVECGDDHVICKTLNNEIYAWGNNFNGQLGIGNTVQQNIPFKCEDWPIDVIDIRCQLNQTIVLTSTQEVYSCGNNMYGQLGRLTKGAYCEKLKKINVSDIIRIRCGYYHTICIDVNNDVYVFGSNEHGQLGFYSSDVSIHTPKKHPSLKNIVDSSSKGMHVFVKTTSNEIYAFGNNDYSQLGTQVESDIGTNLLPTQVLQGMEDIWYSNSGKARAKSARK